MVAAITWASAETLSEDVETVWHTACTDASSAVLDCQDHNKSNNNNNNKRDKQSTRSTHSEKQRKILQYSTNNIEELLIVLSRGASKIEFDARSGIGHVCELKNGISKYRTAFGAHQIVISRVISISLLTVIKERVRSRKKILRKFGSNLHTWTENSCSNRTRRIQQPVRKAISGYQWTDAAWIRDSACSDRYIPKPSSQCTCIIAPKQNPVMMITILAGVYALVEFLEDKNIGKTEHVRSRSSRE
jgi:hypothetical protein